MNILQPQLRPRQAPAPDPASPAEKAKREKEAAEAAKAKRRNELRQDSLYIAGAVLVTIGVGMIRVKFALMTAGAFCLLFPLLEVASGFIRGLRAGAGHPQGSRR
jgi:hypothetical protein